jgi:glycogen operon protein
MDWSPDPRQAALNGFVAGALRLRRELPLLAAPRWLRGEPVAPGWLPAVRWLRPDGVPMAEAEWKDGNVKAMAVAFAGADGAAALILVNAAAGEVPFAAPPSGSGRPWRLRLDSGEGSVDPEADGLGEGEPVTVPGRSLRLYSA